MNRIARLAVPAFFTLIAEPLFLLTDSAIVGHLGTEPLAALGAASALLLTATGVFVFLAYATTAIVSRLVGEGRPDDAIAAGLDGVWLGLALGVLMAGLMAIFAHPMAVAMGGRDVAGQAATYLRVSAIGVPAMLVLLALQGLLRGVQDTVTPLWVTTVGFAINAGLNAWFVLGAGMGIAGSALGTVIAQWLMALAMGVIAARRARHLRLRPHPGRVLTAARVGAPLFVRTVALRAVLLLTTALAGSMGAATLAGHQIATSVFSLMTFALDAIAIAAQTLTGEALGKGDRDDARSLTNDLVRLGWISGAVCGVLLVVTSPFVPWAFSSADDVRHAATVALIVIGVFAPMSGALFVLDGVLMGAGDGPFLAKAQLLVLTTYLPISAALWLGRDWLSTHGAGWALGALWIGYSISLCVRCALLDRRRRSDAWMTITIT